MADWPATKLHTVVYVDHVCAGSHRKCFSSKLHKVLPQLATVMRDHGSELQEQRRRSALA